MKRATAVWFPAILAGLWGCASSSQEYPAQEFQAPDGGSRAEPQRRLEDLALLYDDTIVTQSARTVDFNGQAVVPRYIYTDKDKGGRDLAVNVVSTKAVFGLNENMTVGVTIPYVNKRLRRTNPTSGQPETLRSDGVGDLPIVGKYRFFQDSGAGETTEAAVIFGLELPTGRTNITEGGMRLEQPLQPGSGSVDAILGGAFTRVDGRWLVNANILGKINSEADDYRFGNTYRFDIGGQFRLYPARYERFDQTTVNLIVELNTIYAEEDTFQGSTLADTGGLKMFVTPGLQVIVTENVLFEGAVQLPAILNLHGSQLEENLRVIFGLRVRF